MKKIILIICLTFGFSASANQHLIKNYKIETQETLLMFADCHVHGSTLLSRVTFDANETTASRACLDRGMVPGYPPSPKAVKCQQKGSLTYIIQYASPELTFEQVCGFSEDDAQ